MRAFLFYVMLFCLCSNESLGAADFHAILIGDCFSKDIRNAASMDLQNVQKEVQTIAKRGKYKLKMTVFNYEKPTSFEVLQTIKNLNPKPNDLVLFYFSGHGYRTSLNGHDPWPNLEFTVEHCGISLRKIIDSIKQKGAAFSIILADCCNRNISEQAAPPLRKGTLSEFAVSKKQERIHYQTLFCKTQGIIAIASAHVGKPSYCTPAGSFYTRSFLKSLRQVVEGKKGEVDWSTVFEGAYDEMKALLQPHKLKQDPIIYTNFL